MGQKLFRLSLLLLGLLLAGDTWAQGLLSATLSGKVINEGQGLPGVSVMVRSPNLQGTRTTFTSTNGDYTFASLPSGSYTVTFSLMGFQPVTRQADLAASQSFTVNATLSLASVAAQATVVGRADSISEATQAATTFTSDTLNKLPVARTIVSAVALVPGLNENGPNGAITIAGAMSYDNLYLVNGANIMDNIRSTPVNLFIEDAIQETTTATGGVSAEYGRFAGGVINTITKSGGNAFSGSFRTTFDNPAWAAIQPLGSPGIQQLNEAYEATFGGPILKDKIWFFAAGRYAKLDSTVTTQGTLIPVNQTNTDRRYEAKLTLSPVQSHTLTASYTGYEVDQVNYYFNSYPTYDLASFYDRQLPSDFFVANYNGVLTSDFFVEARYSRKEFTFENAGSRMTDLIKGTPIYDTANVAIWNSPVFCAVCPNANEERNNDDLFAKGTYFLSTPSMGSHNVVVGVDQFRAHLLSNNYQSGSQFFVGFDDTHFLGQTAYPQLTSGLASLDYYPIFKQAQPSSMQTRSAFLNDTWKLNNTLSFNLGIRYDKNHGVDMEGVLRQKDSAWSPRLGVTVDPKADGRLRFNASYARYVSAVQESFAGGASGAGSPAYYYYLYGGEDINTGAAPWLSAADALTKFFGWWGINNRDMFPVLNQDSLFVAAYPGFNLKVADGMQSPHTDEVALGVAGSLGSRLTYRVDGTYRKGAGFIESVINMQTGQVTDPAGTVYDVSVMQNAGSEYRRTYYGLAAQFAWRPIDGLSLGGNWTWSHTYGNLVGETAGSGPLTGDLASYPEYKQASWYTPVGDLPQDQRQRVRLYGSYELPLPKRFGNFGVSAIFQANRGLSYSAVGTVEVASYVTNPGYATPPVNTTYYLSSRGAYTTEAWYQTDLALNYSYDIGKVQLFVQPQILNVFNAQHLNGTNVNTAVYTSVNKGYLAKFNPFTQNHDALIECPATATPEQCQAMGANWQVGPSFGQASNASAYQQPRTFRFSVGLRF